MSDSSPAPAAPHVRELQVVRIKLGNERAAPQPDPLGRDLIGYAEGLTTHELWLRGRGVWKAKLTTIAEADLVLLVAEGTVQLVGTVDGASFHDARVAVTGMPLPHHPLVGQSDPLPNNSQNPIKYGTITTAPPTAAMAESQRDHHQVLAHAIEVLTEAAHLRRRVLHQP
ncbi:MAG: hypothetical protein L0H74_04520, partial [Brachybacterium sp.]|nr:hypothetical protein [Brachybacterium sp.]